MYVLATESGSDTTMTVVADGECHKFDVWNDEQNAYIEYQETLSNRGQMLVDSPDRDIYTHLMQSNEMANYLQEYGLSGVKMGGPNQTHTVNSKIHMW